MCVLQVHNRGRIDPSYSYDKKLVQMYTEVMTSVLKL